MAAIIFVEFLGDYDFACISFYDGTVYELDANSVCLFGSKER